MSLRVLLATFISRGFSTRLHRRSPMAEHPFARPVSRQPPCPVCDHEHHEFTRCHADLPGGALCPCPPRHPTGIYL